MTTYFITGIDTGIGKSIATGLMARYLARDGKCIITAKLVQTGCEGISEDIVTHRKLMGIDLLKEDIAGETCGYVFDFPASPHLAAELAGEKIDIESLEIMVKRLEDKYEIVLLEGAGGLMVPLTRECLTIDLVAKNHWPLIIVSSARLGSINHTLLTIDAALSKGCKIAGIIYNLAGSQDDKITTDTRTFLKQYLEKNCYNAAMVDLQEIIDNNDWPEIDFLELVT